MDYKYKSIYQIYNTENNNNTLLKILKQGLKYSIMNNLSTKQRQCLMLSIVYNNTQEEIAQKLSLTQPTVSKHIKSAIRKVNKDLLLITNSLKNIEL